MRHDQQEHERPADGAALRASTQAWRATAWGLALVGVALLAGCAKTPAPVGGSRSSHINVLIPGRQVGHTAPNTPARDTYNEWIAAHAHAVETLMSTYPSPTRDYNCPNLKRLNPGIKTVGYDNDLTMQLVPDLASLPEEFYLHFSDDTRLAWGDTTVDIPGCPVGTPPTPASRVQMYDGQIKWLPYMGLPQWRVWYADHLVDEMTRDFRTGADNPIDILELDEHLDTIEGVMRLSSLTTIVSGGGIREYGGEAPVIIVGLSAPIDAPWHADLIDWLSYLQGRLAAVNKSAQINVGEYFAEPGFRDQVLAIRGAVAEMVNSPFHNAAYDPAHYQDVIDLMAQLTAIGGTVNLQPGAFSQGVPANCTAGNYRSPLERAQMWNLASYYMLRESVGQPGTAYFNPQMPETPDFKAYIAQWLPAYDRDVGQPLGPAASFQQGNVPGTGQAYTIFGRAYSKALVLVRPRDAWGATVYGNTTAVTVPLPEAMVMLKGDGTFSTAMHSARICNADAMILFPAASLGNLVQR